MWASTCWPKGTLFSFILMITEHMKLFGTNQVLVFISVQDSRDWKLFHSSIEGSFWRNQVDSKKGFKLGRSKAWILKKPSWWNLEESVTLCKILECLSFAVELMLNNHTHLHKLTYTKKLLQKGFKNLYFILRLLTVLLDCRQTYRHVLFRELSTSVSNISRIFWF